MDKKGTSFTAAGVRMCIMASLLSAITPNLQAQSNGSPGTAKKDPNTSPGIAPAGYVFDSLYDIQHPAGFVGLYEQTNYNNEYVLFEGWRTPTEDWNNNPVAEVDLNSRIVVRFNRALILQNHLRLNGEISLRGYLTKADGSKPAIEIPGYSQIGQQSRVASVSIRSGIALLQALQELRRLSDSLSHIISDTLNTVTGGRGTKEESDSLDLLSARSKQLRARVDTLSKGVRLFRDSIFLLQDSAIHARVRGDTASAQHLFLAAQLVSSTYQRLNAGYVDSLDAERPLDDLAAEIRVRINSRQGGSSRKSLLAEKAAVLDAGRPIGILVNQIAASDTVPLDVLSRHVGRDAEVLRREAQTVAGALDTIKETTIPLDTAPGFDAARDSLLGAITRMRSALADLSTVGMSAAPTPSAPGTVLSLEDSLAKDFTYYLKDTYLLVQETGAQPGDEITIIVSNLSQEGDLPREFPLTMRVRQFGLVNHLSDSFLFISRQGIRTPNAPAAGSADTSAAPYNYLPTPGITFGWTLYYRREWWGASAFRWLQPGFGLNVSFPRFGRTVLQTSSTSPGPATTTQTTIQPDGFDLAVGAVITVFDGAIQLSWGRDLTTSNPHRYWAIGFSFIRTVGALQQIAKGS